MASFWKSSTRDKALNGTLIGGLLGLAVVFAEKVVNFATEKIPTDWILIDNASLNISMYIVGAGLLLGFIADKW